MYVNVDYLIFRGWKGRGGERGHNRKGTMQLTSTINTTHQDGQRYINPAAKSPITGCGTSATDMTPNHEPTSDIVSAWQ